MTLLAVVCGLLQVVTSKAYAATRMSRYDSVSGKVIVQGHENIHEWKAEGTLIAGFLEVATDFLDPTKPPKGQESIEARAEAFIPVRNLMAVGESWQPYNEQRTSAIHKKLRGEEHPKISFRLTHLCGAKARQSNAALYDLDSTGELAIAGITNRISMPLQVVLLPGAKLKLAGRVELKQSDFNIVPKPKAVFEPWDSDTILVAFEWVLRQRGGR